MFTASSRPTGKSTIPRKRKSSITKGRAPGKASCVTCAFSTEPCSGLRRSISRVDTRNCWPCCFDAASCSGPGCPWRQNSGASPPCPSWIFAWYMPPQPSGDSLCLHARHPRGAAVLYRRGADLRPRLRNGYRCPGGYRRKNPFRSVPVGILAGPPPRGRPVLFRKNHCLFAACRTAHLARGRPRRPWTARWIRMRRMPNRCTGGHAVLVGHRDEAIRLHNMLARHPRPPFSLKGFVTPDEEMPVRNGNNPDAVLVRGLDEQTSGDDPGDSVEKHGSGMARPGPGNCATWGPPRNAPRCRFCFRRRFQTGLSSGISRNCTT